GRGRALDVLRHRLRGSVPARRGPRGQDPERHPPRRSSGGAADQVRAVRQPADRARHRPLHPPGAAPARGPGDRSIHENGPSCQDGPSRIDRLLFCRTRSLSTTVPAAPVHQPSIRAWTTAHDVSIRSSTITPLDRRGWASQSVSRSWWTINHPENARTGTSALGTRGPSARRLRGGRGDGINCDARAPHAAAAPELLVVDLVPKHDVEANE